MKKTLSLSLTLLLAILPAARAQFSQIEGDPVDYHMLIIPRDSLSMPLVFALESSGGSTVDLLNLALGEERAVAPVDTSTFGTRHIEFKGELRHTWDISPELIEEAIQLALRKTGLTRTRLATLSALIEQYAAINYNVEDFKDDMLKIVVASLGMAGVPGEVGDAITLGRESMVKGTFSYNTGGATLDLAQISFERICNKLMENPNVNPLLITSGDRVMGSIGEAMRLFGILDNLQSVGEVSLRAYVRDVQKWNNRVAALALWQYTSFYNWANYYLTRLARQRGANAWVVVINQRSEPIPFNFSGVDCSVTWSLSANLVKCGSLPRMAHRPRRDHEGEYLGVVWAVADYDFSNFRRDFVKKNPTRALTGQDDFRLLAAEKGMEAGLESRSAATLLANLAPFSYGGLTRHDASISLREEFHAPVYLELDEDGRQFDGIDQFFFEHLAELDKADFNTTAIAHALGLVDADPHNTTKIEMSMHCLADGILEHYPGKPAVPLIVEETVEGNRYTITRREGKEFTRQTRSLFDFAGDNFPIVLPYGDLYIHAGELLTPTREIMPNDPADRERILKQYFK